MKRAAFTLIELMISIFLVVLLLVGVNKVFRIATDTIGAGNAMSENTASNRSIQTVLYNDFQNAIVRSTESPALIIRSRAVAAFKDEKDAAADQDYQALLAAGGTPTVATVDGVVRTVEIDGDNVEGTGVGETIPRSFFGTRSFRQDSMSFFARYVYPRQTGNDGTFAADMTASEAWIWYGHVRQPLDANSLSGASVDPGIGVTGTALTARTNPNNFYARQWGVGRVAMLLKEPVGGVINDTVTPTPNRQFYIGRPAGTTADKLYPLAFNAPSTNGTVSDGHLLEQSRYDLAGTSIDRFIVTLRDAIDPAKGNNQLWWSAGNMSTRFTAFPRPTKPLDSYGAARTSPWLVGGATNFLIEFSGDFLHQDATTGAVDGDYSTATGTDGQVDFIQATVGGVQTRRIRWYGFPRDAGTAAVGSTNPEKPDGIITRQLATGTVPASPDVLPLRDFLSASALKTMRTGDPAGAAFEHAINLPTTDNYANTDPQADYICAWAPQGSYFDSGGAPVPDPPRPTMLRITMTVEDPAGRLPDGQTFEYVIQLP